MKHLFRQILILAFAFVAVFALNTYGEESKQERHWYRVEVQTGDTTYQCIGSSLLEEKEFAKQLNNEAFVLLDDAAYIDANGKIKTWQDWDPKASSRLYVNPAYVILFNPMKGDPRKPALKK